MRKSTFFVVSLLALSAAKSAPGTALMLAPEQFDPAQLIPPPPADGSAEALADVAFLEAEDKVRTPADAARAEAEGKLKGAAVFTEVLGSRFDISRLPATAALLDTVRQEEKAAVGRAKDHFLRNRPWIVDPKLHSCSPDGGPRTSYPSGHASMAFSTATILARLFPEKAPALLDRARIYARSRIVCEQHFPEDLAAGEAYGLLIGDRLMDVPAFQTQFHAAELELRSRGVISR